jgi:Flp pilus assembly protein protease CpaA
MQSIKKNDNLKNNIIYLSIFSSLFFILISSLILSYGHLHEDAYILYIYSENLAKTGVVSYYSGGPPAEGATDFLWMVLIAAFNFFGVPSGVASAALNAVGVFFVTLTIAKCATREITNWLVAVFIAVFVPISNIGQAAFMGFSTAFYSSLIAVMMYIGMFGRGRRILLIPVLGLTLALVRPDGVVIGGLTTILFYFVIERKLRLSYLAVTLGCAIVGVAYFLWRWNYFGEILPLPLIVKSSSDTSLPGLWVNLKWLTLMMPLLGLAIYSLFVFSEKYKKILAVSIPILAYLILLTFAVQSQNVGNRFQAPILVLFLFFAAVSASRINMISFYAFMRSQSLLKSLMLIAFVSSIGFIGFYSARSTVSLVRNSIEGQYIDVLPNYLSTYLNDTSRIALTEAGRLAYWTPGMKYDLVGLNTAETAVNGASIEYLESLDADLIMMHHAGMLSGIICENAQTFCRIDSNEFTDAFNSGGASTALSVENRVGRAASVTAKFLVDNFENYAVYAVRYGSQYSHIYAVNLSGTMEADDFEFALNRSFDPTAKLSYLEIIADR